MEIIRKDTMPDGTKIQLEQWSEYGTIIGTYPLAVNTGRYGFTRTGHRFRLSIPNNKYANYTNDDVLADYEKLVSGEKTLQDLAEHFENGKADMWYLGMFTPGTDEWYDARTTYGYWKGA